MILETLFRLHVEGVNFLAMEVHIPILHPYKGNATEKPINLNDLGHESFNNNILAINLQILARKETSCIKFF